MNGLSFFSRFALILTCVGCCVHLDHIKCRLDRTRAYHDCIAGYMVKSAVGPSVCEAGVLLNIR